MGAFFVGAGKGGVPVVAFLSVAMMSLIMPPLEAAALLLPIYILSDAYGVWLYRREYSRRNMAILIPAAALGILLGWVVADMTDENMVRIAVGAIGLYYLATRLRSMIAGPPAPRAATVPRGVIWGGVCGFTSFVAHAGGPPFQAYVLPQNLPKMVFAGTSTIVFAAINLMKLPPYVALGLLDLSDLRVGAVLAPMALFGAWAGYRLTRLLPERLFFALVELALLAISLQLVYAGLTG
nr:sulfite exporter TauE/SafE family protein [Halovulum dunhuangense]